MSASKRSRSYNTPLDGMHPARKKPAKKAAPTVIKVGTPESVLADEAGSLELAVTSKSSLSPVEDDSAAIENQPRVSASRHESQEPEEVSWWRKRVVWISVLAGVIMVGIAGTAWALWGQPKQVKTVMATPKPTAMPSPSPTVNYDPLTGLAVSPSVATQPVIGVMIENLYPNARPQSGLSAAGVVYEALAEGGITRFLALFQEPLPPEMGPVRSLRPYFLDWGLEHDVPVAHAGGSQPALAEIVPLGMKEINALVYDGSYFFRIASREAPHNLYTNSSLLSELDQKLGFASPPDFTPWPRKSDAPAAKPTATDIHIDFSYAPYNDEYQYNEQTDSYARFMGGSPQTDANTNQQIYVKNVVVEFVNTTYSTQGDGDPETIMQLIGSGKILVFEDGNVIQGTWSKASDKAPTIFDDASGNQIQFNRGNTWISVVPTGNTVTY